MKANQEHHFRNTQSFIEHEISSNLNNPGELEKLYRSDQTAFQIAFASIFNLHRNNPIVQVWNERLNFKQTENIWGNRKEFVFIAVVSCIAWVLAKLPEFTGIDEELFYSRNITFLVFPFLIAYFIWKQHQPILKFLTPIIILLALVVYINMLPNNLTSDSIILACIHLPILLWGILGFAFVGGQITDIQRRVHFLRYNGDFVVMSALILISGALFSGLTMGLFSLIQLDIEKVYTQYILVFGLVSIPLVSTYLVQNNPQLVSKISPIIAKIFTPIVTLMLFIFLISVIVTGKYPYNDRNALMIFNGLLIGVMALILFSITEVSKSSGQKLSMIILCCLSILTIIINGIALFAIGFRIEEFGVTPNRMAVLGANVLIMFHLFRVANNMLKISRGKTDVLRVENSIVSFLPFYLLWALFVTLLFPIIFAFK